MKVAFLIYGEYREFDFTVRSWEFLKNKNFDFYFSTWDVSMQNGKIRKITENDILSKVENAKVFIEDFSIIYSRARANNNMKIAYQWKKLINLIDKEYDIIVLTRFDNHFFFTDYKPQFFYDKNKLNTIYSLSEKGYVERGEVINEIFLMGGFNEIKNFILNLDDYTEDIHLSCANSVNELNYDVEQIHDMKIVVVRPNIVDLLPSEYNVEEMFKKYEEWNNLYKINGKIFNSNIF